MTARYTPSAGDLAYRNAIFADSELNLFEEAMLLQRVSHAYLAVILSGHTGAKAAGTKAMLEAELARRGTEASRKANRIARWSMLIAAGSLSVSVLALIR